MSYYSTCTHCESHLDPCEVCDCMKNAAPVLAHKDGEAEQFKAADSGNIIPQDGVTLQEFSEAVKGIDDVRKVMVEAILICWSFFKPVF